MSVVRIVEIRCDVCGRRFTPSFECVANTCGITKGGGTEEARKEARAAGWKRFSLRRGLSGLRSVWVDCCENCDATYLVNREVWFERNDGGAT